MKNVKFDGQRWWLKTPGDGFFNPFTEVLFSGDAQPKINLIIKAIHPDIEPNVWYEIPNNNIYTALHSNKCRWDHAPCYECDAKGVLAIIDSSPIKLGSTDEGDEELKAIKEGRSSLSFRE